MKPKTQPILERFPVETIRVDHIDADRSTQFTNARLELDPTDIEELARTIEADGVLMQPIVVVRRPPPRDDRFLVRVGHRRTEAFKKRGWPEIRATILPSDMSEIDYFWLNISENLNRKQLTDYEIAKRGQELIDRFEITPTDYAKRVHLSPKHINNLLRWLRTLPDEILAAWKTDHALITQASLEKMSHLSELEALEYWRSQYASLPGLESPSGKRERSKIRRPSDRALVAVHGTLETYPMPRSASSVRQAMLELIEYCMGKRGDLPTLGIRPQLALRAVQQRERRHKNKDT